MRRRIHACVCCHCTRPLTEQNSSAIAKQRQHAQAEEDLAHRLKIEALKEKRLAAKEAAELRLEQRMQPLARGPTDAGKPCFIHNLQINAYIIYI